MNLFSPHMVCIWLRANRSGKSSQGGCNVCECMVGAFLAGKAVSPDLRPCSSSGAAPVAALLLLSLSSHRQVLEKPGAGGRCGQKVNCTVIVR